MRCVAFHHDASMHTRGRIVTEPNATHGKRIRVGRASWFGSVKFGAKASSMSRHLHILVHHFSRITRRHQIHQGITDNGLFHPHVEIQ